MDKKFNKHLLRTNLFNKQYRLQKDLTDLKVFKVFDGQKNVKDKNIKMEQSNVIVQKLYSSVGTDE